MRAVVFVVMGLLSLTVTAKAGVPTRSTDVQMEVIGSFPGSQWTVPMAINDGGQVVGFITSNAPVGFSAITWSRESGFQLLLENAVATDINNRGDITGVRYECVVFPEGQSCAPRGFLWTPQTGFTELGDFIPNAINESGDMAGDCVTETSVNACAQYNGTRVEWVCELPDCGINATSINARGEVVGTRSGQFVAPSAMLLRRDGSQVILGDGRAEAINNSGVVAGAGPQAYAAIWKAGELLQAPETFSVAWGINARGWATGTTFVPDAPYYEAFFWDPSDNSIVRLDPAATGSEAHDINDLGDIVGTTHQLEQAVIWHITRNQ